MVNSGPFKSMTVGLKVYADDSTVPDIQSSHADNKKVTFLLTQ